MTETQLAEVITLYESNVRNIPAVLRELADSIEAGKYGEVGEAAFVLMGDTLEVFGWGNLQDGCSSAVLLQAGAMRIVREVERHGRD